MFRSKLLIGLNLCIGVTVLVYCIITMEVRNPPLDSLCYMSNVIATKSYINVMFILSVVNVSCLIGSAIVSLLALVSLNKALRAVHPAIDPVQSASTSEVYQVHKAIFRTLLIVLIAYHLSAGPITIGVIFASITNKPVPNIIARILALATYMNSLTSPVIMMTRNAKLKRSFVQDVDDLKRALCCRADSEI
ncbi:hypothetical protein DPMN_042828 [Dreissena polymorpha]|uniref:G-protein coupled receptors family 1 profile domain-containing protein n=1 Tax=Dreissena polymorpha TaxID=45954 RepID=A0A9D4D1H9_DREPO|nr:hypothetical protein DPMN_042828 [Dreissena polymorpha]